MSSHVTIITPTLNRRELLTAALDSVARQQWSDVEHIIVDGGSTDGTVEWLRTLPGITLITGADRGVYDAMNKGLSAATGDIIGFLNSDDYYLDGAFSAAVTALSDNPQAEIVCGRAIRVGETGKTVEFAEPLVGPEAARAALAGICLPNARFFRSRVFDEVGPFDPSFRLVSDRDFVLRLLEAKVAHFDLHAVVYAYRQHAGSLTHSIERSHALSLRRELLRLALRWSEPETVSTAIRSMATILEGRSRIGILRDAAGTLSAQEMLSVLTRFDGKLSWRPANTIIKAIVDLAMTKAQAVRP